MNIGVFGGTFDPPHHGHLIIAETARGILDLAQVMFVPVHVPPHKQSHAISPPQHRLEMLRLAVAANPAFSVCEDEILRGGISYTVDTLRELRARMPHDRLHVLIGSDNAIDFASWKEPEEIARLATVVIMHRPGVTLDVDLLARRIPGMRVVDVPGIDIAARTIRERVAAGFSIRYLVPDAVREYVITNNLYR